MLNRGTSRPPYKIYPHISTSYPAPAPSFNPHTQWRPRLSGVRNYHVVASSPRHPHKQRRYDTPPSSAAPSVPTPSHNSSLSQTAAPICTAPRLPFPYSAAQKIREIARYGSPLSPPYGTKSRMKLGDYEHSENASVEVGTLLRLRRKRKGTGWKVQRGRRK